jgi:hypothetical protein
VTTGAGGDDDGGEGEVRASWIMAGAGWVVVGRGSGVGGGALGVDFIDFAADRLVQLVIDAIIDDPNLREEILHVFFGV